MPVYQKSKEVVILRADHEDVSSSGLHCFEPILNPDISDTYPVLSFQIQDLCILCGALQGENCTETPGSATTHKRCRVLYTLLLFEPEDEHIKQETFNILIYACQSCSSAIKECKSQAKERLKYELKVTPITELGFDPTGMHEFKFEPNNEQIHPKTNPVVVRQLEFCSNEYGLHDYNGD
ncbi:hypothetical protein EMCRGX_G009260 [Ephydatia muelleri]